MRGRITQGKRDDNLKESAVLAAVRGYVHQGGSVSVAEKLSGAISSGK